MCSVVFVPTSRRLRHTFHMQVSCAIKRYFTVANVNRRWMLLEYLRVFIQHIAKELKITLILDKLLDYKRSWIKHVNRMPRNRLPRVMKHYCLTGRRNHGRPLKRLLDTWDRNGSTGGLTAWQIYDGDDDDDDEGDFSASGGQSSVPLPLT